ncbi:VOC family protein [Zunongwangia sp. SCSIO 43204]|uniref:VOC family protein n=1 Tax=Zunongwangia sp. SCSIO 43204 TaxID=2779359 RepID=UPI001CA82D6C|nr:VOC family protein [Zunongwangia sp. SCSIO 43204]UAB84567.1 VOC family protein [Zunongwangia sp. SCSIO 43204]
MKLNAGIITHKLVETKAFYTEVLDFGIRFENDFYLLMHTPNESAEISFLLPGHPSQQPIFQPEFNGRGVYLTLEVDNVDAVYKQMKEKGIAIEVELREEDWGDRHFAIVDPNGIGIDIVTYSAPEDK